MDRMITEPFVHKLDWMNHLKIRLNNPIIYLSEPFIHKLDWMNPSQIELNH